MWANHDARRQELETMPYLSSMGLARTVRTTDTRIEDTLRHIPGLCSPRCPTSVRASSCDAIHLYPVLDGGPDTQIAQGLALVCEWRRGVPQRGSRNTAASPSLKCMLMAFPMQTVRSSHVIQCSHSMLITSHQDSMWGMPYKLWRWAAVFPTHPR